MRAQAQVDLEENKTSYIKKLNRQLDQLKGQIQTLEKTANRRDAGENPQVKKSLDDVKMKWDVVAHRVEDLKIEKEEMWPEGSRLISRGYKDLEETIVDISKKIKPK